MRELIQSEIPAVGGGELTFTTSLTLSTLNNVSNATTVGRMAAASFGVGYAVGTWLNNKFNLSTRIVDSLT